MKKETLYAILLGITFGVVFSFVMIIKSKDSQLGKTKPLTTEKKAVSVAANTNTQIQSLKITSPQDKQIVHTKLITFKGTVEKDGTFVIQAPIKDIVVKTDSDKFSIDVPLALGENVINVTFYAKNSQGRGQTKELRIYYLDEQ